VICDSAGKPAPKGSGSMAGASLQLRRRALGERVRDTELDARSFITRTWVRCKRAFLPRIPASPTRNFWSDVLAAVTGPGGFRQACCANCRGATHRTSPTFAYTRTPIVDFTIAVIVDGVAAHFAVHAVLAALVSTDESHVTCWGTEPALVGTTNLFRIRGHP